MLEDGGVHGDCQEDSSSNDCATASLDGLIASIKVLSMPKCDVSSANVEEQEHEDGNNVDSSPSSCKCSVRFGDCIELRVPMSPTVMTMNACKSNYKSIDQMKTLHCCVSERGNDNLKCKAA
eukprot:TRINITY_DN47353_c0_g1_i1.p1 TRINITY_DN47353_c0_g1~~TRINITY_DN47353_c0_g1_i1.p1  ORF type:complete len:122 (-),score=11.74 TRINITY_DN47353_c0_g1_i1:2-367(-)